MGDPAQANIGPNNQQTSSDNVCSSTSTRSTATCAEPESSGFASTPPKICEVTVRSTVGPTQGYSLVVPVQVKGKSLESVVDTGVQVSIINSKLIDISQFEVEPVVLRGLELSGYHTDAPITIKAEASSTADSRPN